MTTDELREAIKAIADECDHTTEQQAVKSTLYSLAVAMCTDSQVELMHHVCIFTKSRLNQLTAHRN